MKNNNDLKELAETLFIKTNLTKTEIAQLLGISRRTVHYWAADNAWDRLKSCTDNMPSIGTENAWLLLTNYQEKLLAPERAFNQLTNDEVNNVCKLGSLVRKLTKGNALNETIELRNRFMEFVNQKNPDKALEVQSMLDDFIRHQAKVSSRTILLGKLVEHGCIPKKEENIKETQLDIQDVVHWSENPPQADPDPYTPDEIKAAPATPQPPTTYSNPTPELSYPDKLAIIRTEHEAFMQSLNKKEAQEKRRDDNKQLNQLSLPQPQVPNNDENTHTTTTTNKPTQPQKISSHSKLNNLYNRNLSKNH